MLNVAELGHVFFKIITTDCTLGIHLFLEMALYLFLEINGTLQALCVYYVALALSNSATPWAVDPRLLCPWDSAGKNTGVGCHSLLQGIFPTQGSNPCLIMFPALAGGFFTISATWEA